MERDRDESLVVQGTQCCLSLAAESTSLSSLGPKRSAANTRHLLNFELANGGVGVAKAMRGRGRGGGEVK